MNNYFARHTKPSPSPNSQSSPRTLDPLPTGGGSRRVDSRVYFAGKYPRSGRRSRPQSSMAHRQAKGTMSRPGSSASTRSVAELCAHLPELDKKVAQAAGLGCCIGLGCRAAPMRCCTIFPQCPPQPGLRRWQPPMLQGSRRLTSQGPAHLSPASLLFSTAVASGCVGKAIVCGICTANYVHLVGA